MGVFEPGGRSSPIHGVQEGLRIFEAERAAMTSDDLFQSFSRGDRDLFKPLVDSLLYSDPYLLFADYRPYVEGQEQVSLAYKDQDRWTRMSILNVARMGKFSSDRSIKEYCDKIWKAHPITVELGRYTIG